MTRLYRLTKPIWFLCLLVAHWRHMPAKYALTTGQLWRVARVASQYQATGLGYPSPQTLLTLVKIGQMLGEKDPLECCG
jgi:hypothetical protein